VERRVVTVTEIFVFKRFQPVLFGLFKFNPEMTLSVIDPINLRYRDVIAAKKDTCKPVPKNSVTANKIAPQSDDQGVPPAQQGGLLTRLAYMGQYTEGIMSKSKICHTFTVTHMQIYVPLKKTCKSMSL
jgi:hypothetical protein